MKSGLKRSSLSFFDKMFAYLDARLPSDKLIIYILLVIFIGSGLYSLSLLSQSQTTNVPEVGGTLVEGVIGTPRFVNPVLAISRADYDLVALTYSGLMKLGPDGTLINDLADNITVAEDGLVYNVLLRQDASFHDGEPVTAEDVAFTIGLIQNPELKSPLRGNWTGVTVEVLGDYELNFVLEAQYAPFIENLTVGILPKHVWNELTTEEFPFSQHNTEPIGSGPYKMAEIKRSPSGLVDEYELTAFSESSNPPKISNISIRFFQNEETLIEALSKHEINATAALGEADLEAIDSNMYTIIEQSLPRVFAVYFNQNRSPALRDPAVRVALSVMVERQDLVDKALNGYGKPTNQPLPAGFGPVENSSSTKTSLEERIEKAEDILFYGDWTKTEDGIWEKEIDDAVVQLAVTIRTANSEVFEKTAEYLEETWSQLGVEVGVELFEQSDLVQAVIRPRDYQALLFGAEIGRSLDLYPFWHSSEREDPGLNISLYTNITTDKILSDLRVTQDKTERDTLLRDFTSEVTSEVPAVFLFSPSFTYVIDNALTIPRTESINRPSERFSNISDWHMKESQVWPVFAE